MTALDGRTHDAALRRLQQARADSSGGSPAGVADALLTAMRAEVETDGGALVVTDPQTLMFTTGAVQDLPAQSCHPFFSFEVGSTDPRSFVRAAAEGSGASAAKGGSDAFRREVLLPHGFDDEARVLCRDAGAVWGALSLWRRGDRPAYTAVEVGVLDAVAPTLGAALRDAVVQTLLGSETGDGDTRRGLLVLDGEDVGEASTDGLQFLRELSEPSIEEYRHLDHLRALARQGPRFSTLLTTADGRWVAAHGSPLASGKVAVIFTSARPADMFGTLVAAAGLTPREVEVTRLLCRGLSDLEIAADLVVSPHTVHDHVRAVRRKLGVRSRGEVAARIFAEHYFDHFLATAALGHADRP
jgi:DNA-binding CsgD family transcriptional regulator